MHSNSLIKNLTPLIKNLTRMTQKLVEPTQFSNSVYLQTAREYFIKMASLKIDFYFEVFKQLKNHVLSYLTGAT